jgi:hypothetical protein
MSALSVRPAPTPAATGRPRRRLLLARIGWCLAGVAGMATFTTGIPSTFAALHRTCAYPGPGATPGPGCTQAQLALSDFRALGGPSAATAAYATYALAVILAASLVFFAVGGLIAWRKWNSPLGLFVSVVLVTFGATGISNTVLPPVGTALFFVAVAIAVLQYPLLAIFLLTFPTGRFAPRWSALLILLWIGQFGLFIGGAPAVVTTLSVLVTSGLAGAIQLYRYRHVYTPEQRQQTKWVVFSFVVLSVLLQGGYALAPRLWPMLDTPGSWYRLARIAVLAASWMPISLCIGIAILRTGLYDIDVLIRRTLVYGTLTAVLGGIYAASVAGSQALAQALTGHHPVPPIAVVASTLLIAGLFNPVRKRIQATIDRRFYRRRYDATKTVAAFSLALRDEVDLTALTEQLLAVVARTLEPAQASLWLAPTHGDGAAKTRPAPEAPQAPQAHVPARVALRDTSRPL